MKNNFKISGIDAKKYHHVLSLDKKALADLGAVVQIVDKKPGYPCRASLQDAEVGEEVILFPYVHHDVSSPYRASGPIFVRKYAQEAALNVNEVPVLLKHRLLSLRVYDDKAMMIDALTVPGKDITKAIETIFNNDRAAYIQVHNAGPGCYNCQINRVI